MYKYGGIYLDLDYVCLRSFDSLNLSRDVGLIPSNNTPFHYTNSFIISRPGSLFWLKCIDEMKISSYLFRFSKHLEVFNTTGPYMINRVARTCTDLVEKLSRVCIPCNVCSLKTCPDDNSYYIRPIVGNSWHSFDSRLINIIYCFFHTVYVTIVLLFFIIILLYKCIKKDFIYKYK